MMIAVAISLIVLPVLALAVIARPKPVRLDPEWFHAGRSPSVKKDTP